MIFSINRVFIRVLVIFNVSMCWSITVHSESENLDINVAELKSLKLDYKIDLTKIFLSSQKISGQTSQIDASKVDDSKQAKTVSSLELVGTLILGEKKFAWLKVNDNVFQLESGQLIPGLQTQISQIKPELIVLNDRSVCDGDESCDSSFTLKIGDVLF